jgi:hypothetical protein
LNGNTTEETITHDLTEMKAKGFGGVLLVDANGSNQRRNENVPAGPLFGSPQWTKLYVHALDVAAKLGLEVSLNITSGWNLGGPTVRPEKAVKLLTWSRAIVEETQTGETRVGQPPVKNGFYKQIAVLAYPLKHGTILAGDSGSDRKPIRDLAFKMASRETGFSMPDSAPLLDDFPAVDAEQDTDVADVHDVSAQTDAHGTLHWKIPAGTWEIVRVGYTDSDARVSTSSGEWQGLTLDYMDHEAFDDYWKDVVVPLLGASKPYIGKSLKYLVTDSWELGGINWTGRFREEFIARRGYDPLLYLPIVTGRILNCRASSNQFLNDLRRTVGDLIVSEHYDVFAEHARQYGLGTHPESGGPHGAPLDALETFRSSSFPQTEYWSTSNEHRTRDWERFFLKEGASAAHIYGKQMVAAEGMTSIGPQWSESLGMDLKPSFDQALTEGMNRLIWHEFTSSPSSFGLPGEEYFAGTHLNPNVTWWHQSGTFFAYLNRCQFLLQQGKPVSDVLYYYGDHVPNFVRLKEDDPAHVLPGYDYDVANEDALLHRILMSDGRLETPEGIRYRALVLPVTQIINLPVLKRIEEYVREGGTVIGLRPRHTTGLADSKNDSERTKIADAMWFGCDGQSETSQTYGAGIVYCTSNARAALMAMKVAPDFEYQTVAGSGGVDFVHRRTGDADIYFVRNTAPESLGIKATFRTTGKEPEIWHAESGQSESELMYEVAADQRVVLPLSLEPYGSVFVVFRRPQTVRVTRAERDGRAFFPSLELSPGDHWSSTTVVRRGATLNLRTSLPGKYQLWLSDKSQKTTIVHATQSVPQITGPWKLFFPKGWGAPDSVSVENLHSWTQFEDAGVRYFSGTATYQTTLDLSEPAPGNTSTVWLDLGEVYEVASVRINGVAAGTVWKKPLRVLIGDKLKRGSNTIAIEVTNLWPNRLIGDAQPSATTHYTHTNIRKYTKDSPLLPSGLIGPVTMATVYEIPLQ